MDEGTAKTVTGERIRDEQLMAYADGELGKDEALVVERAVASDPELARRLKLFKETRAKSRAAYAEFLNEPVPPAVMASVRAMIGEAQSGQRRNLGGEWPALAKPRMALPLAAMIAASFGVAGYLAAQFAAQPSPRQSAAAVAIGPVHAPEIAEALSNTPAGEEHRWTAGGAGRLVRLIASFRDNAGRLCREFEMEEAAQPVKVAVACRTDSVWHVGFAMAAPGGEEGYAPASASEALDAYLASMNVGDPLTRLEERTALRALR